MKNTNQVQKALEDKGKKELRHVVDEFMISLNRLNSTYHQPHHYTMYASQSTDSKVFEFVTHNGLENILQMMLEEAYLNPMVNKKTKELLSKLELL